MKINKLIKKIFHAKKEFHKENANMTFEKKIAILVKLQKIASEMKQKRGKKTKVWKIYSLLFFFRRVQCVQWLMFFFLFLVLLCSLQFSRCTS